MSLCDTPLVFDFRYHVASLIAVFIALVIGILVGIGLSGKGFVSDAERKNLEQPDLRADERPQRCPVSARRCDAAPGGDGALRRPDVSCARQAAAREEADRRRLPRLGQPDRRHGRHTGDPRGGRAVSCACAALRIPDRRQGDRAHRREPAGAARLRRRRPAARPRSRHRARDRRRAARPRSSTRSATCCSRSARAAARRRRTVSSSAARRRRSRDSTHEFLMGLYGGPRRRGRSRRRCRACRAGDQRDQGLLARGAVDGRQHRDLGRPPGPRARARGRRLRALRGGGDGDERAAATGPAADVTTAG